MVISFLSLCLQLLTPVCDTKGSRPLELIRYETRQGKDRGTNRKGMGLFGRSDTLKIYTTRTPPSKSEKKQAQSLSDRRQQIDANSIPYARGSFDDEGRSLSPPMTSKRLQQPAASSNEIRPESSMSNHQLQYLGGANRPTNARKSSYRSNASRHNSSPQARPQSLLNKEAVSSANRHVSAPAQHNRISNGIPKSVVTPEKKTHNLVSDRHLRVKSLDLFRTSPKVSIPISSLTPPSKRPSYIRNNDPSMLHDGRGYKESMVLQVEELADHLNEMDIRTLMERDDKRRERRRTTLFGRITNKSMPNERNLPPVTLSETLYPAQQQQANNRTSMDKAVQTPKDWNSPELDQWNDDQRTVTNGVSHISDNDQSQHQEPEIQSPPQTISQAVRAHYLATKSSPRRTGPSPSLRISESDDYAFHSSGSSHLDDSSDGEGMSPDGEKFFANALSGLLQANSNVNNSRPSTADTSNAEVLLGTGGSNSVYSPIEYRRGVSIFSENFENSPQSAQKQPGIMPPPDLKPLPLKLPTHPRLPEDFTFRESPRVNEFAIPKLPPEQEASLQEDERLEMVSPFSTAPPAELIPVMQPPAPSPLPRPPLMSQASQAPTENESVISGEEIWYDSPTIFQRTTPVPTTHIPSALVGPSTPPTSPPPFGRVLSSSPEKRVSVSRDLSMPPQSSPMFHHLLAAQVWPDIMATPKADDGFMARSPQSSPLGYPRDNSPLRQPQPQQPLRNSWQSAGKDSLDSEGSWFSGKFATIEPIRRETLSRPSETHLTTLNAANDKEQIMQAKINS